MRGGRALLWLAGGAVAAGTGIFQLRRWALGSYPTKPGTVNAPHPKDDPVLGSVPSLGTDLLGTFVNAWRECGDVVYVRSPRTMCLVAHPDHVKHVLIDRQPIYPRSEIVRDRLRAIMGNGLFSSDGALWSRQRRLVQPAFHGEQVKAYSTLITDATSAMLDGWQQLAGRRAAFDVSEESMRLGFTIIGRMMFGEEWDEYDLAFREAVLTANEYGGPRVLALVQLPQSLFPSYYRYRRAMAQADAIVYRAIDRRRHAPTGDLISLLLQARDAETGQGMSDEEARDEIMTAIFGMYKSIPHALTWTWYLLSKYPAARRRLQDEVADTLQGRAPTLADFPGLEYTRMVIDEVLRLYPPLWIMSRPPTEDDEIGGYHIPKGLFVLLIPYITHRHPDFWENPDGFDPERFSPERSAGRHPGAYFPFTIGKRRCVGDEFSLIALRLIVATVAQRFSLNLVPEHPINRQLEFIMRPINGMPMTLERVDRGLTAATGQQPMAAARRA